MNATTIVLADDHHVVRKGMRAVLEAEADFRLVGEASDGLEAVQLVERLRPDVLVLDLMMPGLNGLEVTRQVGKRSPQTHILILSMHAGDDYVLEALRTGATGYVLKDTGMAELVKAVRETVAGRRYLSLSLAERAIDAYVLQTKESTLDRYETLTDREREVANLLAFAHKGVEVAVELGISPTTVSVLSGRAKAKLGGKPFTRILLERIKEIVG